MGLATNVVVVPLGEPARKVTLVFNAVPSTVAVTVLRPDCVEARVVVNTPDVLVVPDAGANVFAVPVAVMTTGAFCTGALLLLSTVTVMVVVAVPLAVRLFGLATMVELVTLTCGVVNVTFALVVTLPATKALTVSVCTVVDDNVAENVPAALVLPEEGVIVLFVPEADKDTDWLGTGLPWASRAVVRSVAVLLPSAASVLGLITKVVVALLTGPGLKVTVMVAIAAPAVPVTVFASALVDAMVVMNCPELLVVPAAELKVLFEPVLDNVTA